ncbi:alpha/beta fold hydrolase [Thalassotalea profundi]|uniref:Alpha/beta hydrolase n=1 Tax=Thalassotalea profundi TaxID=2036687 RepID=A0ABQ3II13_9GAMM|nr:alpha/beta fold hydrolase [Thalassotalea profundi]GHE85187.1 alpha/beta hydrolase [Thalassotalea profundi]
MSNTSIVSQTVTHAKATVIFAHGAGADKNSDFLNLVSAQLLPHGINVLRFNFPYMDKRLQDGKRRPPDRMPKLIECLAQVIEEHKTSLPLYLMGKSMGGRVAATLAKDHSEHIRGVICLGYPFHPHKQPDKLRLEPLQNITKPVLIIQGDRDALGNKCEIERYEISTRCQLHFLPDGDHDLKPRVKSGHTHQQHLHSAITIINGFINENNEN